MRWVELWMNEMPSAATVLLLWINFSGSLDCIVTEVETLLWVRVSEADECIGDKICVRQILDGHHHSRRRVVEWTYCEIQATSASVLKIIWLVLLLWTTSPLIRQRRARLCGSAGEIRQEVCTFLNSPIINMFYPRLQWGNLTLTTHVALQASFMALKIFCHGLLISFHSVPLRPPKQLFL